MRVHQLLHRGQELRPEVVVAALALDRLGDERGDVVGVRGEGRPGLLERPLLGGHHLVEVLRQREDHGRDIDPGPVEHGEALGLVGLGVGQRQGVAAAAVERPRQVQDPGAQSAVPARGLVLPGLPVEGHLEGVLHRQRAALDEEQVGEGGVAEDPDEGGHELRVRRRVHVRVGRLVGRDPCELIQEGRVVDDARGVEAERCGGEEGVHVEVAPAVPGIDQPRSPARLEVDHQLHAVGQDAAGQHLVHLGGRDVNLFGHGWAPDNISAQVGRDANISGSE